MYWLLGRIKDLLFPKFCAGCRSEGDWICAKCFPKTNLWQENQAVAHLDGVTALFEYGENIPSKLIRMFKYNYLSEIAGIFEKVIDGINFNDHWLDYAVIAVPLHARRERERGFNQSELIAELFAKKLALKINNNLSRVVYTVQQAKLSGEDRRKNLQNAFVFTGSAPEKVLLVDDVFTTGATMQECAKVLKDSGVKVVYGLVLARG